VRDLALKCNLAGRGSWNADPSFSFLFKYETSRDDEQKHKTLCRAGDERNRRTRRDQIRGAKDNGERRANRDRVTDPRTGVTDPRYCNYPEKGGSAMMKKTTAAKRPDVQDDVDPNGPKTANKPKGREAKSQLEGPAAYAPHDESEKSNRLTVGHLEK
jgi:hypothetical protein